MTAETDPAFHRLWRFYLWSGVRRREALSLTRVDIERKHELIMIPQTKNRRPKVLRIPRYLPAILDDISGEVGKLWPWAPDAVSHHFNKTAKRAGIKARIHDLRHTYASYLLMPGVQLKIVKELLGHRDIKATRFMPTRIEPNLTKPWKSYPSRKTKMGFADYFADRDFERLGSCEVSIR